MPVTRHLPIALLLGHSLAAGTGCSKKPSPEQCEEFTDHFVELLRASQADDPKKADRVEKIAHGMRPKVVDACAAEGTVKEVECVLAAESITEVEANCN